MHKLIYEFHSVQSDNNPCFIKLKEEEQKKFMGKLVECVLKVIPDIKRSTMRPLPPTGGSKFNRSTFNKSIKSSCKFVCFIVG